MNTTISIAVISLALFELVGQCRGMDRDGIQRQDVRQPAATYRLIVTSEPSGAQVYLKRYAAEFTDAASLPPMLVGTTPLELEIPRCDYVIRVKKEGYAPLERTISGATMPGLEKAKIFEPTPIDLQLVRVEQAQPGMVFVPGGEYTLRAWRRLTDARIRLVGYWIDKYEVTNRRYQEFVDAGGYGDRRFWIHPFVKDGRTLSWEDAWSRAALSAARDRSRS